MRPPLLTTAFVALAASAFATCARQQAATPAPDAGTAKAASAPARSATVVVTGALVGHLEPCGCSPDQRGGIARAAGVVDRMRDEGRAVVLVDGGDRFVDGPAPADGLVAQQRRLQAQSMAEATRLMKYDALVLGDRDAQFALDLIDPATLPPLLDTGETARQGSRASLVVDRNGLKIGLFAVGRSDEAPRVLAARAGSLRESGAEVVVLLAYRTFDAAKALLPAAKEAGVDAVIATRAEVPETTESAALASEEPPLFAIAARGEAVLRLDFSGNGKPGAPFVRLAGAAERDEELSAMQQRIDLMRGEVTKMSPNDPMRELKTKKLLEIEERRSALAAAPPPTAPPGQNTLTAAFVPTTPGLGESKQIRAVIDRFDTRVSEDNLAYAKANPKACPAPKGDAATFVGDERCLDCHEEAMAFWKTTGHAHAFQTLVDKKKQFNVQCISCHVTGWEQPGGACSIADNEGRRNVQCESCHGPGSLHSEAGDTETIALAVPEKTCRTCHDPVNSPHFNYETYRPQILGPGHGAPLPKKDAGSAPTPGK